MPNSLHLCALRVNRNQKLICEFFNLFVRMDAMLRTDPLPIPTINIIKYYNILRLYCIYICVLLQSTLSTISNNNNTANISMTKPKQNQKKKKLTGKKAHSESIALISRANRQRTNDRTNEKKKNIQIILRC